MNAGPIEASRCVVVGAKEVALNTRGMLRCSGISAIAVVLFIAACAHGCIASSLSESVQEGSKQQEVPNMAVQAAMATLAQAGFDVDLSHLHKKGHRDSVTDLSEADDNKKNEATGKDEDKDEDKDKDDADDKGDDGKNDPNKIPIDWWSNMSDKSGCLKQSGKENVKLGNCRKGVIKGDFALPSNNDWEVHFSVMPGDTPDRDTDDQVVVKINGNVVGEFKNDIRKASDAIPIKGNALQYEVTWMSSKEESKDHQMLLRGEVVAKNNPKDADTYDPKGDRRQWQCKEADFPTGPGPYGCCPTNPPEGGWNTCNGKEGNFCDGYCKSPTPRKDGNCPQCNNGGSLKFDKCECACPAPWGGPTCDECKRKCLNGVLDNKSCSCKCKAPWTGPMCATCPLFCRNNGQIDPATCQCKCMEPWSGPTCETCNLKCLHGGQLDSAECKCKCTKPWGGRNCNQCILTCENGGILEPAACACRCAKGWTGAKCQDQDPQVGCPNCVNGGMRSDNKCNCICPLPWVGPQCQTCPLVCKNKGVLDPKSCTCLCKAPWSGMTCDMCTLKCMNGGIQDGTCACRCPPPWKGDSCEICDATCEHGGKLDMKACECKCPGGWAGQNCETCSATCEHSANMNPSTCSCTCSGPWAGGDCQSFDADMCPPCENGGVPTGDDNCGCTCSDPWAGAHCEICNLNCLHGGTLDDKTCSCKCQGAWTGKVCEKCNLECSNGGSLDEGACKCVCVPPWLGPACERCPLRCKNGGTLKMGPNMCKCDCLTPWTGDTCERCDLNCRNGGELDDTTCTCQCTKGWSGLGCDTQASSTCKPCEHSGELRGDCECTCNKPWGGDRCESCSLDCKNDGVRDSASCSCSCTGLWTGPECNTCSMTKCKHEGDVEKSTCTCKCKDSWAGDFCEVCSLDCVHGTLNPKLCKCTCEDNWTGKSCDECTKKCQNEGRVDTSTCTCRCLHPWTGENCETFDEKLCPPCLHGERDKTNEEDGCACACSGGYTGVQCETCSIQSCANGSTLDEDACACVCKFPWSGPHCNECKLECPAGRLDEAHCRCVYDKLQAVETLCLGMVDGKAGKILGPNSIVRDLAGHWDFNDGIGLDGSGNGNNAMNNPAKFGPGVGGHGQSYFADGDGLVIPHSEAFMFEEFTVSLWLYILGPPMGGWRTVIRKGEGNSDMTPTMMLWPKDNRVHFRVTTDHANEGVDSVTVLPRRQWVHIGAVMKNRMLRLYVNGVLDNAAILSGQKLIMNKGNFYIGKDATHVGVRAFIDEVKVYTRAVAEFELQAEAATALGPYGPNFARLGCHGCTYEEAHQDGICPDGYRLCREMDLKFGGLYFARMMGWLNIAEHFWSFNKPSDLPDNTKGVGICCQKPA